MREFNLRKRKTLKNELGITLIALVVTIVVLLILAGTSISMLAGENGVITQSQNATDKTEQGKVEEMVNLAITGLVTERKGDRSGITPEMIAEEIKKMENRTDIIAESSTFPTNIIFEKEGRKVEVDISVSVAKEKTIYNEEAGMSEEQLIEEAEKNIDLFLYEVIDDAAVGTTEYTNLPTKTARITGIKPEYCHGQGLENDSGEKIAGYYEIYRDGEVVTDTLVVPYQVEIEGEIYKITEVKLSVEGVETGSGMPIVKTIIYPNTVKEITGAEMDRYFYDIYCTYSNELTEKVILQDNLISIGEKSFFRFEFLKNIKIPTSVTNIGKYAFYRCNSLTSINIPSSVTSIGESAFARCDSLTTVNYGGTQEQWNQISIGINNKFLTNATINYNYTGE